MYNTLSLFPFLELLRESKILVTRHKLNKKSQKQPKQQENLPALYILF